MSLPQRLLPVEPGEPAGTPGAGAGISPRVAAGRSAAAPVLTLSVLGLLLGPVWAWVTPFVARISDGAERVLAGEVAMAGVGVAAGLLVAVIGVLRPGPRPTARLIGSLLGSGAGSVLAWRVGLLVGAPRLAATGVLVFWPLTVATVTVVVTLVVTVAFPDRG